MCNMTDDLFTNLVIPNYVLCGDNNRDMAIVIGIQSNHT